LRRPISEGGNIKPIACADAYFFVLERRYEMSQKIAAGNYIGVDKYYNFAIRRKCLQRFELVVYFLRASAVNSGHNYRDREPGALSQFTETGISRIILRGDGEDYIKIRIVLVEQFLYIFFEARVQSLAGQNHRHARRELAKRLLHFACNITHQTIKRTRLNNAANQSYAK